MAAFFDGASAEGRAFLGAGLAFPLALTADGRFAMNGFDDHVRQSVLLILGTARGERVMRPEFGAALPEMAFAPLTAATAAQVEHEVRDALTRGEPRIDVTAVTATACPDGDGGARLDIHVEYVVRRTDTMFNLVYPFYLERTGP